MNEDTSDSGPEARLREYLGDIDETSKKGRKRRAILDVATQMFAEQGYRQTAMDEIAARVGVAKGTLYLYYPTKIELLIACGAFEKLRWIPAMIDNLRSDKPADDRLKDWLMAMLLMPVRSPLMGRMLEDAEMAAVLAEYPAQLLTDNETAIPQLLQPVLDELAGPDHRWNAIELRDRANVLRGLVHIAPMLRHDTLRPGMTAERFAAILADLVIDGIRPRGEPR